MTALSWWNGAVTPRDALRRYGWGLLTRRALSSETSMHLFHRRRKVIAATAAVLFVGTGGVLADREVLGRARCPQRTRCRLRVRARVRGDDGRRVGREPWRRGVEALTIAQQLADARTAPGIVAGAYSAAYTQLASVPATSGSSSEVTDEVYDADDPRYRDWYSNSSGGAGNVTGISRPGRRRQRSRLCGGGRRWRRWRSSTGGGNWARVNADQLPSLSSGTLVLANGRTSRLPVSLASAHHPYHQPNSRPPKPQRQQSATTDMYHLLTTIVLLGVAAPSTTLRRTVQ